MKHFEDATGSQVDAMLDGIERDLTERKRGILQQADRDAQLLLRLTRRRCRQRGRQAVAEERTRMAAALTRTEAALASDRRRHQQEIDAARLARGLEWLRAALLSRWADPATRRHWVETAVREAATMLAPDGWRVEFAQGLDEASLAAALAEHAREPSLAVTTDIEAGLRIQRGGACLDTTIDGLLARESDLSGELLAEMHKSDAARREKNDG